MIKHRIDFDTAHLDWSPMLEGKVAFWLFQTDSELVGNVIVGRFAVLTAEVVKWGLTGCLIRSELPEHVRKAFKATFDPLIDEWFQKHPIRQTQGEPVRPASTLGDLPPTSKSVSAGTANRSKRNERKI